MRNAVLLLVVWLFASTPAAVDAPWAEKLVQSGTDHDFGTVARGAQLSHTFILDNPYAVPLEITTRVGCSCVAVNPATQTLQPKQKAKLEITMDARRFTGPKTVNIYVTVSAPQYYSQATLTVAANSRADVVLNPGEVSFGVVQQGQKSAPQTIDVEYAGELNWKVTELVYSTAALETSSQEPSHRETGTEPLGPRAPIEASFQELYRRPPKPGQPGQVGYRVSVAVKADAPAGSIKQELYLKTNDPASPLVPILVEGTVQATLAATPNPVAVGSLKLGESVTKLVVVRGNKPFRIVAVEGLGEGVAAELPTDAKRVQTIRVKCQPQKTGDLIRQLLFKTDLDDQASVSVKVEGKVNP
jgi:hypothetical protein